MWRVEWEVEKAKRKENVAKREWTMQQVFASVARILSTRVTCGDKRA